MHIKLPKTTVQGLTKRISVEVTTDAPAGLPKELWFEIPTADDDSPLAADDLTPFVLCLIPPAMRLNEDITIEGSMSESLYYALEQLQTIFSGWYRDLHPVKLHAADRLTYARRPTGSREQGAGSIISCFSGGVDSFHTLKSYYNHPSPRYRVTHALFGLFGPPFHWSEPTVYEETLKIYDAMLAGIGVKLLSVRTNAYDFCWPLKVAWEISHALTTAASMHVFGSKFSKGYIPSSYHYKNLFDWGSHPLTDPLLSTEGTQIVHDAIHVSRMEKTQDIAAWELAQQHLNVCVTRSATDKNCGRCTKCLRTMLQLVCTPHARKFCTFPKDKNGNFRIIQEDLRLLRTKPKERPFLEDARFLAQKEGKYELVNLFTTLLNNPSAN